MTSPADAILRVLAMKQQEGAQNKRLNQVALSRFFNPVNAGIARGQTMANQRGMQESAQAFQGDQSALGRDFTAGENAKSRGLTEEQNKLLRDWRSGEAGESRQFRGGQMDLDRELTREGIASRYKSQMASIAARQDEGAADRAFALQNQLRGFDQRDKEFKKQTRVAFARDVRAAMQDVKADDQAKQANIEAIKTRYGEEMKLQTKMAAMNVAADALKGGGKTDAFGLATPTAYLTSGAGILKGNAMGDRFDWVTPEMERDIMLVMRASFKKASATLKEQDPEMWKILDESLKVLEGE